MKEDKSYIFWSRTTLVNENFHLRLFGVIALFISVLSGLFYITR